ncbi:MAG: cysteine hydrolase family protein [Devosia sp.]
MLQTSPDAPGNAPGPVDKQGIAFGPLGESWVHLCIDMQRMFAEATDWQTPWLPMVLPRVIELVELAPERTVFTRFVPPREATDAPGAWQRYYERWPNMTLDRLDPELVNLMPEFARYVPPARLFDKAAYSPWLDGQLHRQLRGLGVDTVVVSGAETEVCVLAAVIGAMDLGYRVIIVTDAICSSADQTHDAALEVYHNRFGMQVEVVTTAQMIEAKLDGMLG